MNVNNSEKKNFLIAALAVLMTVMALVSCAPSELRKTNGDNVDLYFGYLEAKDVNETAYDVTVKDLTWTAPNVVVGNAADYFWSYTAVKGDNLFKEGETTAQKNVSSGAGLSGTHNFSKGKWTFTLYAYKTSEERTARTKYIFKGEKTGTWTAGGSIDVPVSYAYIAGTGTAEFNFTVTISQEDSSTFGTTYNATKVIASIGGTSCELSNTSGTNTWSKTTSQEIASGVQTVGLKVYVDNESSPRIDKTLGSAIILHGLTTKIGGSATISLTAAKAEVTFSPVLPTSQPTEDGFPIEVGDIIELGSYPATYTNSSGTSVSAGTYANQPVTWKVLEVDETNNKALVISEKLLTFMKHQTDTSDYTWSGSLIRTWLNNTGSDGFISQYGLSSVSIAEVTHDTDLNRSTESTTDKVFLLSVSEVNTYFADDTARVAKNLSDSATYWWLRSRGSVDSFSAACVDGGGDVCASGDYAGDVCGVRPAFWINL